MMDDDDGLFLAVSGRVRSRLRFRFRAPFLDPGQHAGEIGFSPHFLDHNVRLVDHHVLEFVTGIIDRRLDTVQAEGVLVLESGRVGYRDIGNG